MGCLVKIKKNAYLLRYLPQILYFNFKMLPFCQAIKLPIWFRKPHFNNIMGEVIIDVPQQELKSGMIRFGEYNVNLYPDSGCMLDIRGKMIFKGPSRVGNNSFISIGNQGKVVFGSNFVATTSLKLVSYESISFGHHVLIGWDCMFMDSDFHHLTRSDGSLTKGYGTIEVGDEVWFGNGTKCFKNVFIPSKCVVATQTILTKAVDVQEKSVIGESHCIQSIASNTYRDYNNDKWSH